jgi:hypothetical protein
VDSHVNSPAKLLACGGDDALECADAPWPQSDYGDA